MTVKTDELEDMSEKEVPTCSVPWYRSCRYTLAVVSFLGFLHIYAQRVGVSVAIVCMVNHTGVHLNDPFSEAHANGNDTTTASYGNGTAGNGTSGLNMGGCGGLGGKAAAGFDDGPFLWDKQIQGHILGSFFYGYLVSQVPGGMLAERFGGKWVFFSFTGLSTVATLLSPIGARTSYVFFIVLRILAGVGSGAVYPCMHAVWSQWAPPHERSKLTAISYAGSWMGNIITMPLAGILCEYGFDGGWGSVFYLVGISSVLWLILWAVCVSDTPAKHPRIDPAERDYIMKSLGGLHKDKDAKQSTPWLSILTSRAVWAIIIAAVSVDWGLYTFLTQIPTYLFEVLKFDVQSNGAISALPFIGLWVSMTFAPLLADKLISSKRLTIGVTRKVFQAAGAVGAAVLLFALSFIDCTRAPLAVGLLILGVTASGFQFCGFLINPMDIAPDYAGTIFGIANGLSAICGFTAPYVTALLTTNRTQAEWQHVFFLAAAIYVIGCTFFAIFSSGELQSWASNKKEVKNGIVRNAEEAEHLNTETAAV